ncbi:substrate-binding domain-containing protein [Bacillus solimangrovi]|uniref:Periplasmic binding protein domain-containing protein n=1 Tax=Bacillus solimangrovi TaxID=1305675 RepID=A0A1E5LIE9_9BACI|nr:substrate-binding domain-containing protein [Bacillus solimangrovi]OEH93826.1 hypothetical protein BFG57_10915 [Bacillus solimangrovi]
MKALKVLLFVIAIFIIFIPFYHLNASYQEVGKLLEGSKSEDSPTRIAIIYPELGSYSWKQIVQGAMQQAQENEMILEVRGSYNGNVEEMVKEMNVSIASNVDGILVMGMDDANLNKEIDKAVMRGIPVITFMNDAPTTFRKAYVGPDYYEAGIVMGQLIAEQYSQRDRVGIIGESQLTNIEQMKVNGIKKVLKSEYGVEVVEGLTSEQLGVLNPVQRATNAMLNRYPKLDLLIGVNARSTEDLLHVIENRARMDRFQIFSFNRIEEMEHVDGSVVYDNNEIGEKCILLMKQWLAADRLPLKEINYVSIDVVYPYQVRRMKNE